jgi:hypothetical protein
MTQFEKIKFIVAIHSNVTHPYGKIWSASMTIGGMDMNGTGNTIEQAYIALTDIIYTSNYYKRELSKGYNNGNT